MAQNRFTLENAAAICVAPYLAREARLEAARNREGRRAAARAAGVAWSGMGETKPPPARTVEQVRADAEAACLRAAAFADSPRGRFLENLRELERLGEVGPAEAARAAYARGFADPELAASPAELAAALGALAGLSRPPARAACLALAELLAATLRTAAE